jgi:RNA recognition motif-containing protein
VGEIILRLRQSFASFIPEENQTIMNTQDQEYYQQDNQHPYYYQQQFYPNANYPAESEDQRVTLGSSSSLAMSNSNRNIYVRSLSEDLNDQSFLELCSRFCFYTLIVRFGQVTSSKAILDLGSKKCKGYGFAMFASHFEGETAIRELQTLGYVAAFAKVWRNDD